MNLSRAFQGGCDLKVVHKTDFEKLAQQVILDLQGKIIKAGVNTSELKG
jgi:hypothetical protein